jgi:hypothetical protein
MKKWLVNSVLLLAVAGNAAIGMPLHTNEESCPMGEMDCCKKAALAQNATPQMSAARLCCALNCSQDGTTPANNTNQPSPQPLSVGSAHPASIQPILPFLTVQRYSYHSHGKPVESNPAYIRYLSLLI